MQPKYTVFQPAQEEAAAAIPAVQVYQEGLFVGAYRLTSAGLTLGKAPTNDLVVASAYVSRRHARISGEEGCWCLEDLGSTNGTFVYEGDQLLYSSLLQTGAWVLGGQQEIRLGPHPSQWRLVFSDPTTTAKPPPIYIEAQFHRVWVRSLPLQLPPDQYAVLLALYQQAPHPCSLDVLCATLDQDRRTRKRPTYSALVVSERDSLHHLIHRLRARIELNPHRPRLILQEPHFGYRLQNEPEPG